MPHLEHILDVFLGSTGITTEPALAALYEVRVTSIFQATSEMDSAKAINPNLLTRSQLT